MIARLRGNPDEPQAWMSFEYRLMELNKALAALDGPLLRDFVSTEGEGLGGVTTDWIDAVATLNGPTGEEMLLSFIDPNIQAFAVQLDVSTQGDHLALRLAKLAQANQETTQRILALSSHPLAGTKRDLYLKLISQIGSDEAVLAGLEFLDDADGYPVPYDLWKALEEKLFDKRPIQGVGGSYNLEPRSANEIRAKLFLLASSGDHRSQPALKLLGEIEVRRLEDGRPPSELRHPSFDSGLPWPPVQPVPRGG